MYYILEAIGLDNANENDNNYFKSDKVQKTKDKQKSCNDIESILISDAAGIEIFSAFENIASVGNVYTEKIILAKNILSKSGFTTVKSALNSKELLNIYISTIMKKINELSFESFLVHNTKFRLNENKAETYLYIEIIILSFLYKLYSYSYN